MDEKVTLSRSEKILKACVNGDGSICDIPQSRIEKLLLELKDKISGGTIDLSNYYTKDEVDQSIATAITETLNTEV